MVVNIQSTPAFFLCCLGPPKFPMWREDFHLLHANSSSPSQHLTSRRIFAAKRTAWVGRRNHQGVIWIFPMASLSFALRFRKVPRLVSSHRFIGREGFLPQPQGLALAEGRRWGGTRKTLHFWYLKNFCEVAWPPTQPLQATRGEFDDPWLGFGLDGYFRWALFNRLAIVEWVMGPPIPWPNINGLSLRFFHTYFCGVYDPEKPAAYKKKAGVINMGSFHPYF